MTSFESTANGIASLLQAVAWPGVVLFLALRYREHVGRLIDRLRKGGPAEFDPVPAHQAAATAHLNTTAGGAGHAIEHLRTAAIRQIEEQLGALPGFAAEPDAAKRDAFLLTVAAKAVQTSLFEKTEANIYASQVELLNYLNSRPGGETASRLKQLFYDPATVRFPDLYRTYAFEGYLSYLQTSMLVSTTDLRVSITPLGKDYLLWRVEQQKAPRIFG